MPAKPQKAGKKSATRSAKAMSHAKGKSASAVTLNERLEDMRSHGKITRKSKASALAFLQRAGIVDDAGELALPFRN